MLGGGGKILLAVQRVRVLLLALRLPGVGGRQKLGCFWRGRTDELLAMGSICPTPIFLLSCRVKSWTSSLDPCGGVHPSLIARTDPKVLEASWRCVTTIESRVGSRGSLLLASPGRKCLAGPSLEKVSLPGHANLHAVLYAWP